MQLVPISQDNRELVLKTIERFGSTSDHNLDWFSDSITSEEGKPFFVSWPDGTGLLAHRYSKQWRIWSDPLCLKQDMAGKIGEFVAEALKEKEISEVWCDYVSDFIYPALRDTILNVGPIYYSLLWPVLDMAGFDPTLAGGRFKEIRNAKNKFYKEHKLEVVDAVSIPKDKLHGIIERWKKALSENKKDVYDLWYHKAIDNRFKAFSTARVLVVDGNLAGINAGYEVPNNPGRFAGAIGIHDYSVKDLGIILYLEDLEWIKNAGYREVDLQGSEENEGLEIKLRFGAVVERKTDTFCIKKL